MFELSKNDLRLKSLFDELVPMSGKCDSLAGELVRAANRIDYRNFNDGDHVGVGYGKETCNPAARFLLKYGDSFVKDAVNALWGVQTDKVYDFLVDVMIGCVCDYVESNPDLRKMPTENMFDSRDPDEDVDDEDGNEEDLW